MPETAAKDAALAMARRWRRLAGGGFCLEAGRTIYVNPVGLDDSRPAAKADIVLLTDTAPERYSPADVERVSRAQTIVAGPRDCVARFRLNQLPFSAGQSKEVLGIPITAARAAGYVVALEGARVLVAAGGAPEDFGDVEFDAAVFPDGRVVGGG